MDYTHVIVGGGLAGASAVEGIREHDKDGRILMLSRENHPPYHRPPLSKDLWFGKKRMDELPVHPDGYYADQKVDVALRREVADLDPDEHTLWDDRGTAYRYERLLLATGGRPKPLPVEGADADTVHYYRYLEDYLFLRERAERAHRILIVGGGFIGSELAAALTHVGKSVIMIYPEDYPLRNVLPRPLGEFVADFYRDKGVETVSGDSVAMVQSRMGSIVVHTQNGVEVPVDLVVAGLGLRLHTELADAAGLEVDKGILVDEQLRTSNRDVFAAGDVAEFYCVPIGERMRVEHWDNAIMMGRCAGANMAGAERIYDHLPMFFSDLFELGWEAVGKVDARLDVVPVWKQEHREGILYYLEEGVVKGVLLWNVWERVDWARQLISAGGTLSREELVQKAAL